MPLLILLAIAVILLIMYISISNKLARSIVKIDEAESSIDVALTKRYDVLTKQLDITKAFAEHEKETLETVINLRKGMSLAEKSEAIKEMARVQERINVVAESYPELRSSENFRQLQIAVNDVEEHLQAARRAYNANVSAYNQMLVVFPDSVVANIKHLAAREFFEAEEIKRQDVKMQF